MTNNREPDVLVIVPAFNEAGSVKEVVRQVIEHGFDVVVVDDGSNDETAAEAHRGGAVVLSLPVNLGVGGALRCGFRYAIEQGYDTVVQCDADGQHPPRAIETLLNELMSSGADMIIGSRFLASDNTMQPSWSRRIPMTVLAAIASRATSTSITDATSGFRVIRRPLLEQFAAKFPTHYLGDTFDALCAAGRAGYTVREVGAPMTNRTHGVSSASTLRATGLIFKSVVSALFGLQVSLRQKNSIGVQTDRLRRLK